MSLPKINVKIIKREALLRIVENSVLSDNYLFRNLPAKDEDGNIVDILENGRNSCGVFVSWILLTLELIKKPHASVDGLEKDMQDSGWYAIDDLRPGAVLFWEARPGTNPLLGKFNVVHGHAGFYFGEEMAISNDSRGSGFPRKHHLTYNNTRRIQKIYWHDELNS